MVGIRVECRARVPARSGAFETGDTGTPDVGPGASDNMLGSPPAEGIVGACRGRLARQALRRPGYCDRIGSPRLPRRILIVDDEQHIRLLIEQALEELEDDGVELLTAADGEEALAMVERLRPDLVFLDIMMPKRNGFEVCRSIKQEMGQRDAAVVMLTAKGQAYDREQGLAAGADQYITKPFDPDELLRTARTLLGL